MEKYEKNMDVPKIWNTMSYILRLDWSIPQYKQMNKKYEANLVMGLDEKRV